MQVSSPPRAEASVRQSSTTHTGATDRGTRQRSHQEPGGRSAFGGFASEGEQILTWSKSKPVLVATESSWVRF